MLGLFFLVCGLNCVATEAYAAFFVRQLRLAHFLFHIRKGEASMNYSNLMERTNLSAIRAFLMHDETETESPEKTIRKS